MKTTRRGLFGMFAGALAAPAVTKILPKLPASPAPFSFPTGYEDALMYDFAERYLRPASVALANELDSHLAAFNGHLASSVVNLSRFPCPIALNDEGRSELVIEWDDEDFA